MASVNMVVLVGNLGKDPELKYTQSGKPVANFSVATTEKWGGEGQQMQERTEWHRIVVWGKQAENCKKYLQKGSSVFLQGRIETRVWDDSAGQRRESKEIVADTVRFLSKGKPAGAPGDDIEGEIPF